MAAFVLNVKRVDSGHQMTTGAIPKSINTEAGVNVYVTREPDRLSVFMETVSEAQQRAIFHYAQAIALGTNTSSVETAISAII